jgi:hypothetical protein
MAQLVFSFPWTVDAQTAIKAVADHFGAYVSINGAPVTVPAHIKHAVENVGGALLDTPDTGVETSPAIAFGALINGAAPNGAQSSAVAGQQQTAPVVPPVTSQITPAASLAPAPQVDSSAVAPVVSAAQANLAALGVETDSTGLPWDERIHSGNKTKSPSGEWRTKKGVDKSLVKRVTDELRAAVGNGSIAPPVVAPTPTPEVSAAAFVNEQERKRAALEYAHNEAVRVAGPQIIDAGALADLLNNKPTTLTAQQNEWFNIYVAKRGAAYQEFMARPNVAAPTPGAPVSQTQTGSVAPAQAADQSTPVASLTAGVGTAAPATSAPQGELDATGLPWDARINVGAKIRDAAGVWVQRFDVSPDVKMAVMAELRAAGNASAVAASNTQAGPASTPVAPPPLPVAVTAADARTSFVNMMKWVVANQIAGRITATAAPEAAAGLGFAELAMMNSDQYAPYLTYVVDALIAKGAQ